MVWRGCVIAMGVIKIPVLLFISISSVTYMPEKKFIVPQLSPRKAYCGIWMSDEQYDSDGREHWWQSWNARIPTQPTEELIIGNLCYETNGKFCAENRSMRPKASAGLSDKYGFYPIVLSPGSWQTCLGLRYHVPVFCTNLNFYLYCAVYGVSY